MPASRSKLTCDCGGDLSYPVPSHCPHCGARIVGVSPRFGLPPLAIVVLLFAALLGFFWLVIRWMA
jgi:hypothetical protein